MDISLNLTLVALLLLGCVAMASCAYDDLGLLGMPLQRRPAQRSSLRGSMLRSLFNKDRRDPFRYEAKVRESGVLAVLSVVPGVRCRCREIQRSGSEAQGAWSFGLFTLRERSMQSPKILDPPARVSFAQLVNFLSA